MTFARRSLLALCFTCLLARAAAALRAAPHRPPRRPAQPPRQQTVAQPAQQAYSLPPDKLAKAIALSRIRNILGFVGGLWGLAVLWLLLATRAAAGLAAWAERAAGRRWMQGLLFFAASCVITTLASLPLDFFGQHVSRATASACRAGEVGWATRPRPLDFRCSDWRARAAAL